MARTSKDSWCSIVNKNLYILLMPCDKDYFIFLTRGLISQEVHYGAKCIHTHIYEIFLSPRQSRSPREAIWKLHEKFKHSTPANSKIYTQRGFNVTKPCHYHVINPQTFGTLTYIYFCAHFLRWTSNLTSTDVWTFVPRTTNAPHFPLFLFVGAPNVNKFFGIRDRPGILYRWTY